MLVWSRVSATIGIYADHVVIATIWTSDVGLPPSKLSAPEKIKDCGNKGVILFMSVATLISLPGETVILTQCL